MLAAASRRLNAGTARLRVAVPARGAALAAGLLGALAVALLWPPHAAAIDLTPWEGISPIDDLIDAGGNLVQSGFRFVMESLFGGKIAGLTQEVVTWLVEIPNLRGGNVGKVEATVAAISLGLLGAVLTLTIFRFWVSTMSPSAGGGGGQIVEGLGRCILAVGLIASWPSIFRLLAKVAALPADALIHSDTMSENLSEVLGSGFQIEAFALAGVPMFLGIAVAVVGILMLLAVVALKIIITTVTVVVFVAMPLALVLWPIPELSWIAGMCGRVLTAALMVPVVWALLFASFIALWGDWLVGDELTGSKLGFAGDLGDALIVQPMVAIALLYLSIAIPRRLLAMAPLMGGGGGSRIGGTIASIALWQTAAPAMQRMRGGGAAPGLASGAGAAARSSSRGATAGAAAAAAGAGAGAASSASRAVTPAAKGAAAARPGSQVSPQLGLPVGSGARPSATASGGAASAARRSAAAPGDFDGYGGPRVAHSEERAARIAQRSQSWNALPESERPSVSEVRAAHAELPDQLRSAASRAVGDQAASPEKARRHISSWMEHGSAAEHQGALETLGRADVPAWREGVGRAGNGAASGVQPELHPPRPLAPESAPARSALSGFSAPAPSEPARSALEGLRGGSPQPGAGAGSRGPQGPGGPPARAAEGPEAPDQSFRPRSAEQTRGGTPRRESGHRQPPAGGSK